MSEQVSATVIVLERNRRVGQRIARVITSAVGFGKVSLVDKPSDLDALVGPQTRLVACGEVDIDHVTRAMAVSHPDARFICWSTEAPARVIGLAQTERRLSNIVGWPSFQSMPRPWELAMAAHRLIDPDRPGPGLSELLRWGATHQEWKPGNSMDRDVVVAEISQIVLQFGTPARTADRIAELAHELLMNAMYDAPVDDQGTPRYAYDRTQEIVMGEAERPTIRLATDGILLAIEVVDPFGGLRRSHVVNGIIRGLSAIESSDAEDVVDTSHGGAGLGIARVYANSAVLLADVTPGWATRVCSIHELDVSPRELRRLPGSLHYFDSRTRPSSRDLPSNM